MTRSWDVLRFSFAFVGSILLIPVTFYLHSIGEMSLFATVLFSLIGIWNAYDGYTKLLSTIKEDDDLDQAEQYLEHIPSFDWKAGLAFIAFVYALGYILFFIV